MPFTWHGEDNKPYVWERTVKRYNIVPKVDITCEVDSVAEIKLPVCIITKGRRYRATKALVKKVVKDRCWKRDNTVWENGKPRLVSTTLDISDIDIIQDTEYTTHERNPIDMSEFAPKRKEKKP